MKHAAAPSPSFIPRFLSVLLLAFAAVAAHADDYLDVNTLLRQGKAAEALAKADAYIAAKPRDPQMRFLRGVILTEQGKQAEAVTAFTQLTQDFPELPEPYNNLAALKAASGDYDGAKAALDQALRAHPGMATAHENLGDVQVMLALRAYARALQLDPANTSLPAKLTLVRQLLRPLARTTP
jgi:Flp pilus assembly protein TadD